MRLLKGSDALPPWVDVERPGNKDYWVSPALPHLPVRDTMEDGRFEAIVLTALVVKCGKKRKPYVEIRPVRMGMTLKANGVAVPDGPGEDGLFQTLAYGSMPLDAFLKRIIPPLGRSVTSYMFSFYEDGMEVVTNTISGGYHEPQIAVAICRGYDKPKKPEDRSYAYANMQYLFNEGAKSLVRYAKDIQGRHLCAK